MPQRTDPPAPGCPVSQSPTRPQAGSSIAQPSPGVAAGTRRRRPGPICGAAPAPPAFPSPARHSTPHAPPSAAVAAVRGGTAEEPPRPTRPDPARPGGDPLPGAALCNRLYPVQRRPTDHVDAAAADAGGHSERAPPPAGPLRLTLRRGKGASSVPGRLTGKFADSESRRIRGRPGPRAGSHWQAVQPDAHAAGAPAVPTVAENLSRAKYPPADSEIISSSSSSAAAFAVAALASVKSDHRRVGLRPLTVDPPA